MNFENAVEVVLRLEGGLSNRDKEADPGLLTNWGISLRAFPELGEEGIRNLTREDAKKIYFDYFWKDRKIEKLPEYLKLPVFDFGIHSSPTRAARELQIGLTTYGKTILVDGFIGKQTAAAAKAVDPEEFLASYQLRRIRFLRALKNYEPNKTGWEKRVLIITARSDLPEG
ncbi:MAG: hypothetical protein EOP04_12640 [Proteobacteria bacterium]|nr:MAG: hypothetical protein EOP04_12640 [Pseudomonadota bacterium]